MVRALIDLTHLNFLILKKFKKIDLENFGTFCVHDWGSFIANSRLLGSHIGIVNESLDQFRDNFEKVGEFRENS